MPVGKSGQPAIKDVTFAAEDWPDKHLRTLHHGYAKARHYGEVVELLAPHYEKPGSQLADFNRELIERIARYLGWTGTFHLASDYPSDEMADARLAQLTLAVGGSTYVSGAGGQNYQSPERFARAGLTLDVRTYQQVPYERSGWPFVPGLSVLDALLHLGRGARDALRYTAE